MQENREAESSSAGRSLFSGAIAGLAVDLILYPLDTMKTRMQSKQGFKLSGGMNSMYQGVRVVAVGSAPGSALFFFTYSYSKDLMGANGLILMFFSNWWTYATFNFTITPNLAAPLHHAFCASIGEVCACLLRVPTEIVKQRCQTSQFQISAVVREIYSKIGFSGFYKGFSSTVLREVPFRSINV